jgi:DNA helicase-2/ATP-dependent DNA helicase PcrA
MRFIRAVCSEDADEKQDTEAIANACLKEISRCKNRLPEEAQEQEIKYPKVYEAYHTWLSENQKLDFDDMLRLCYLYLSHHPDKRKYWQERFSYILIDEFQDINPLQYETIKLLAPHRSVFAVGDDDQAIYGFRGAEPAIMQRFVKDFHAEIIRLSHNYRCSGNITEAAIKLIGHNQMRFEKNITAAKAGGEPVVLKELADRTEERLFLEQEINSFGEKYPQKTQAVLCRTNKLLQGYDRCIAKEGENLLWKDVGAYLSFINAGRKREDFLKLMNKPMRYISRTIVTEPVVNFESLKKRLEDKPWIKRRIEELEKQMALAERLDLIGQLHYIWNIMGYEQYIRESCNGDEQKIKEYAHEFAKLLDAAGRCGNLQDLSLEMEKKLTAGKSNLKLMTYHGAKGLEFDRVYLPDLNYGKVPHGRMLTEEELEEERRMFYVALTRAKESLVLIHTAEQSSPFLTEIN